MKKLLLLLCSCLLIFAMCGCGGSAKPDSNGKEKNLIIDDESMSEEVYKLEETPSPTPTPAPDVVEKYYTEACNITKKNLKITVGGGLSYGDFRITEPDLKWIDNPLNTSGTVENGAIYRYLANCLEAFDYGNSWETYSKHIVPVPPTTRDEFAAVVPDLAQFITHTQPGRNVLMKLSTLESVKGSFDFEAKNFSFVISDLTECAKEMGISEEMLGYILAMMTEYAPEMTVEENTCVFSLKVSSEATAF